jgi:hypothetical protein
VIYEPARGKKRRLSVCTETGTIYTNHKGWDGFQHCYEIRLGETCVQNSRAGRGKVA